MSTETNIITKIELFDFMRCFFCDDVKYQKLTQNAKKPHLFMWQRFMSIMYPVAMHAINGFSDIRMMDQLHKKFCIQGGPYPKWMYASTQGGSSTTKEKPIVSAFPREVIDAFMAYYGYEYKSLLIMEELFPTQLKTELTKINDEINAEYEKEAKRKRSIKKG